MFFTSVFFLEFMVKFFGLGCNYFRTSWNIFDFTIVCISAIDIFIERVLSNLNISFLRSGTQLIRVFRVMRVTRLFKLMKSKHLDGINSIIKTIIFAFPSLMNVFALLFLIYFIFAVLGCELFSDSEYDSFVNNRDTNFNNFTRALITLFRCSTGEDWHLFLSHYSENLSSFVGIAYFLFYIFLSSFIMLNMFTLVVTQQFELFYFAPDNPITSFEDWLEVFNKYWNTFTNRPNGFYMMTNGTLMKERN